VRIGDATMKAIILSAGQGKRLLPMTADLPKCLLPLGGKPLIGWQVDALHTCGIDEIVVVTGFAADRVERALEDMARPGLTLRAVYNPFYAVADNLASCWLVRRTVRSERLKRRSAPPSRSPSSKEPRLWSTRQLKACAAGPDSIADIWEAIRSL